MRSKEEVAKTIKEIIIPYCDCFAWNEFSDRGGPCYAPDKFDSKAEEEEAAYTRAASLPAMSKFGELHTELSDKAADCLQNKYVTYDWLVNATARLLTSTSYEELFSIAKLSREVID